MKTFLENQSKLLTNIKTILALSLVSIPLFLWWQNDFVWLDSISEYVHHTPKTFKRLLYAGVGVFLLDGLLTHRRENILTAFALWGVVFFDNHEYFKLHYAFAITFFTLEWGNMVVYAYRMNSWLMATFATLIFIAVVGCFLFEWLTILIMEWIALAPIAVVYAYEQLNKRFTKI